MKRRLRCAAMVALLFALAVSAHAGAPPPAVAPASAASAAPPSAGGAPYPDPRKLSYGKLSIAFPKPDKVLLPNGLLVYLFEDHELPLIDLAIDFKAGEIFDPPEKIGLADLTAGLMRTGGTAKTTPDDLDEALAFMPAQVAFFAGYDMLTGSVSTVKDKFPEALRLFADMLRAPRFDAKRLEVEKARDLEEIRRRWDDPGDTAELTFRRLAYGTTSPWARLSTEKTVSGLGRDDLIEFHKRYIHPNNAVLGVAGDFNSKDMKKLLEETFRGWSQAKVTPPVVPKIKDEIPAGVHLVNRPLTQSHVEIGHLGVNRFDPDKFAIKILNFVLGEGGFSSRLTKEVRSTRGLAYSVGGGIGIDSDRGLFQISCSTKAGSTVEAIDLIRQILRQMREEGPTEQEVKEAKESSINSFVFSVDGTVNFMRTFLYYDFYNYPPDFLQTYRDKLAAVTRDQVQKAARAHLNPDRLVVLVVGNDKSFDRPLQSLGLGEPRPLRPDEEPETPASVAPASRPRP